MTKDEIELANSYLHSLGRIKELQRDIRELENKRNSLGTARMNYEISLGKMVGTNIRRRVLAVDGMTIVVVYNEKKPEIFVFDNATGTEL